MLPNPTLSVTIPSIHDGTLLDCRIYHPSSLTIGVNNEGAAKGDDDGQGEGGSSQSPRWRGDAAILAHPYAPLGGSFDDPLVDLLGAQILRRGFLLGTFNFRGAGSSAGRTSWTAKPERDDYASFVGFLVCYIRHMNALRSFEEKEENSDKADGGPALLLGGYSYGALVTTLLPPLHHLLDRFASPAAGSEAAQIRLRAASLAEQQQQQQRDAPGNAKDEGTGTATSAADGRLPPRENLAFHTPAYLLISPLRGVASFTVTLSPSSIWPFPPRTYSDGEGQGEVGEGGGGDTPEAKLTHNQTLALFGDDDTFVTAWELRAWARRLTSRPGSRFRFEEVASAGHFWSQEGVLDRMMDAVDGFAGRLLGG